jgi:response regulator NasT
LHNGGYQVAGEGASKQNALALARSAAPDVLLMAVGLPEVDGIETSREVMQAHPLPIVLITSHYDAATIERAKRAGVMGYLVKPLRPEEFSPAIELAITHFQDFAALREENSTLKETIESRKFIERAKGLLMEQRNLTEDQAYTLMKKASMNMRKPMAEVAQAIILAGGFFKGDKA